MNDATQGVLIRIHRTTASAEWTEAVGRLNARYPGCDAAGQLTSDANCPNTNGCFFYWIKGGSTMRTILKPEPVLPPKTATELAKTTRGR